MFSQLGTLGQELARGMLQLLYPGTCHLCSASLSPDQAHFCHACRTILTTDTDSTCPRCAATVGPHAYLEDGCFHCRGVSFHFERVLRLGRYDGLLRQAILRLKQASGEGLAEVLGALWAEHAESRLRAVQADVVVPVPLHWR